MKSFKQMIKDGDIKRADAMKVRIEDIHEEPGFNLRDESAVGVDGKSFQDSIDDLAAYIVAGGILPPLEVRPREDGGVFIIDGHRRRRAYLQVADKVRDGSGELWLSVVAFTGNDADRVARIITSAEGRALSPLEVAKGYRRLIAFNWTPEQIAAKVGKTRQHVDQALILANANSDVQAMVAGGSVSATSAIDAVRKHGDEAGKVLGGAVDAARAAGKSKATSGAIKGKPLPRALVSEVEETLIRFADTYSAKDARPDAVVVADLLEIIADIRECRKKQAERGQAKAVKDAQTDIEQAHA